MTAGTDVAIDPQKDRPRFPELGTDSVAVESRLDRRVGAVLFAGILAVYVAVTRGTYYAYDSHAMMAVTMNIVNHASLKTTGFKDPFHLSTPYSPYGIGVSVLAILPYTLSKAVGHANFLVSMINPVLTATAVLMVYKTARALRWQTVHALVAAIGFGLFTQALQATTELFAEPAVTLCVVALVYGVVRWGDGDPWSPLWVGLSAGAAVQFRPDSLFTFWIGLLALPLFVPWRDLWRWRPLLLAGVPMAASLLFLVWYDELRYHKPLVSGYGGTFSTALWTGLHGILFDPGKSIFIFNALALLGLAGVFALVVRNRPLAVLYLLLIVPRLLFFSKWSSWDGGWAWGPRFMLPAIPLLVLAAVELLRVFDRRTMAGIVVRVSAAVLAIFSACVNYLSVRVPYEQWLQTLAGGRPAQAARLGLSSRFTKQQVADYDSRWSTGAIWGDVTLLRHGFAVMALDWWAHDRWYVGLLLLAVGAACLTLAFIWALGGAQRNRDLLETPPLIVPAVG